MARYRSWLNRLALIWMLCISTVSLSTPFTVAAHGAPCGDSLAPRLTIGALGRVTAGNSNNVRDEASKTGKLLGQIPAGEHFEVLDGPVCAAGLNWWLVDYNGLKGWTVEAAGTDYWLEPYDPNQPETLIPTDEVNYQYEDIHFQLDPALAAHVTAFHSDPVLVDPNFDGAQPFAPSGVVFSFTDTNGKSLPFSLRVYSVEDFIKQEPDTEKSFATLYKQFEGDSGWRAPTDEIPVLSIVRQPELFRARTSKVDFANGSGYRFLTQTSFDVRPIVNPVDYLYSGLTYDNAYYVVIEGRVNSSLLPNTPDSSDSGTDFENRFEAYRKDIVGKLTNAKGEEFTSNLNLLDGFIRSLQVHGPEIKVTIDNGMTHVKFKNISFDVDSNFAKAAQYKMELADWKTMSPLPEHVCFALLYDPSYIDISRSSFCIIPTEGMDEYVKELKYYITEKPALDMPDGHVFIPTPYNGAAQLIHAQMSYIDTNTLQGVRFVTRYAQMDYYIGGNTLRYDFSGLTRGGNFIIFLEHGADTELLSDKVPNTAQLSALLKDPSKYYKRVIDTLNAGSSADFSPNLDILDAIVKSIRIK